MLHHICICTEQVRSHSLVCPWSQKIYFVKLKQIRRRTDGHQIPAYGCFIVVDA